MGASLNIICMESFKKWLSERTVKRNGMYVHYSPPKLVDVVSSAQLRQWARGGAGGKLERAVLAGKGRRVLSQALPTSSHLPALLAKCEALHKAVERGSLLQLQELLDSEYNRKKLVMCRDESGVGLLHKAVYYGYVDIAEYLVKHFPELVHEKDSEGRTPLHYSSACREEAALARLLEGAGAARGARDAAGRTPAAYRAHRTLLALPSRTDMPTQHPQGLVIKRHNIRIWCHDCDMAKLQRVVWEGHGQRLLSEVSSQPVVKKFLEAVPYIMNTIRDIHSAVIENDLEGLMKHAGDPVPPQILSSRDGNNMTVMHKAAGLGHGGILGYIADRYPQGINDVDNDGRTPLHYAAAVRDDQHMYNTLVSLGADEGAVDNKNKTPGYYVNRPQEIDKNLFKILPDAPRTPSSAYPASWDWRLLDAEPIVESNKKTKRKNHRASNENISSKNNSNSISENSNIRRGMKNSSTQELIKKLPDLDDSSKKHNGNYASHKESEVNEENDEGNEEKDEGNEAKDEGNDDEEGKEKVNENEEPTENEDDPEITEHVDETHEEEVNETEQEDKHNVTICTEDDDKLEHEPEVEQLTEDHDDNPDTEKEEKEEKHEKNGTPEKIEENMKSNDDNLSKETGDEQNGGTSQEEITKEELIAEKNDSGTDHVSTAEEEDLGTSNEGNNSHEHNEDDDDVQTQGDTQSEYSDAHQRSTAEATDTTSAKRGNETDGRNTQESLIEGIISGEAEEDSQDASITQTDETIQGEILVVDSEIDPEVADLINTANMEMLAQLVLNGEGSRLVGRRSGNMDLQAFLDNVPTYMQKINKVHLAAREGNIRDLQSALDRRKFAIARDTISPNGATPLHVATVCGKTNIMKYLGGRFPETLSAVDFEGRTALHYAAVLPDNGHYYNLLQQLGANAKDLDDNGRSAEDYFKDPGLLPYSQLLTDFGIDEETAHIMLSDKVPDDCVSSRRALDTPEALETLERCYRLLASARPMRTPLSASSNRCTPPIVLSRFLKRPVFDTVKFRVTKLDHDLFDIIWPAVKKLPDNRNIIQTVEDEFPGGVTAPDYYAYEVFHEFLLPLVKDLHNMNIHSDLPLHPPTDFDKNKPLTASPAHSSDHIEELNVDPSDDFILSGTIECSRNLHGFELPLNLKVGQLETVERIVTALLMQEDFLKYSEQTNPESDQKGGSYYTLNEVLEKPSEICATLASAGLLIALCDNYETDDCTRLHGKHWPYGRGVFVNEDKTIAVWINVHDHIRVLVSSPPDAPGEIGIPFNKLRHVMTYLHERLDFEWDYKLGHLSSRPTFLGAGIRFSFIVNFPGLSKDVENMKHLCAMRGLQYRESLNADIARISNYQCLGITEINCFHDFVTATSNLLHLERDLSMQNSAHIATLLSNIFKRKRSSIVDADSVEKH